MQFCVIYGKSILGSRVKNISQCLMSEVRRVEDLVERLGALLRWMSASCEAALVARTLMLGPSLPPSWTLVECSCVFECMYVSHAGKHCCLCSAVLLDLFMWSLNYGSLEVLHHAKWPFSSRRG